MNQTFRAIMFDLNRTLLNSLANLANATNHALATLDCPTHPLEAYRQFVGDGARVLCERALPGDRQALLPEMLRLMREHYAAHCFELTRPYAGIPELLSALTERRYKLAVLSNKPDDFTKQVVAHYFKDVPFAAVRGGSANIPLKPDPTGALQIAGELEISTSEWLYLGDTNTDMHTARQAGMFAVGVLWGFREREELLDAGAATLIARPEDFLTLL